MADPENPAGTSDPLWQARRPPEPTVPCASQHEMRFGSRSYTAEQSRFIEQTVRDRTSLTEPALPIGD